ncbi:M20/M25/M40 family metallo-hydrolase [soil metagenome]
MKKNSVTKNILALFLMCAFIFPSFAAAQTATKANSSAMKAAATITAAQLKDYLYFVASDEMEGRDTPSRGLDLTAKFIGTMLSRWNFKPAGDDGTFYQKIALVRESPDAENSSLTVGGQKFNYGEDYYRVTGNSASAIAAPIVYGGNGWFFKAKGVDALQNVDVKGKTVVLYSDGASTRFFPVPLPKGITQADFAGKRGEDWIDPITYAKEKGAVGVIIVASNDAQKNWERLSKVPTNPRPFVEKFRAETPLPTIFVSQKVGDAMFADAKAPYRITTEMPQSSTAAFALDTSKNVVFRPAVKQEKVYTQNVVALWEGSDPQLKSEMVAIGAHYDHVGVNPNAPGDDKIWNGADDDGSGTVSVLAIAEALAKSPVRPKRSILLVWHAGEEKGLWGSEYFNKFPTVDIKNVVAQLNIDMIGRSRKSNDTNPKNTNLSGENEVYVIGSQMMSSKLGDITKSVNNSYLNLNYDYKYDDPKDTNRFFFRSDHFHYALNGIPIVFWFDGVHEDYHQPGDEPQKIDYDKMQKIARTIFLTMWEIAELPTRPAIDKQLPPELTQR